MWFQLTPQPMRRVGSRLPPHESHGDAPGGRFPQPALGNELQPRRLIAEQRADRTGESQAEGNDQSCLGAAEGGQRTPSPDGPGPTKTAMILAIARIEVPLDIRLPLRS